MIALPRRWPRFSLRTLFVLVTVLGAAFGWIVYGVRWMQLRHAWMDNPPTIYLHTTDATQAPWAPWLLVPFGEGGYGIISMRFCAWDEPEPVL